MKSNLLLFLVAISLSCTTHQNKFQLTDGIFITDATILTSGDGKYHPFQGYVVTDQDKIIYVGKEKPDISGNYQEINGEGKYLIPGLIDSHVHITEVQGMVYQHMEKYPDLVREFKKQLPRSYLYFGFTTLINLGGISEDLLEFFNEQPLAPGIYHTGRSGAMVANGYPMNFVPKEFRFENVPNFIYMESEAENIPDSIDPADHTPEAVVGRIKGSGAIAVKSYYERGFRGKPDLPVPTKDIIDELLKESHKNGLVLTVHGNSLEAHKFLTQEGVDVIAHGMWNWEKYRDVPVDSLPEEIKAVLDQQIEKQIGYTPTLTVLEGERVLSDTNFLNDPQLKYVVPGEMIKWYKTEEGQWFAKELFEDFPANEVNRIYGNIQSHAMRALNYLSENGGLILFGTDTPSAPTYGNPPGYNGYMEIKLMYDAGVPLDQILASATLNNAKTFHLDSLLGSIDIGKHANMILMLKNPLEEVDAYDNIETIIVNGEAIDREEFAVKY